MIPWVVMGWGHLAGNVPTLGHYFRPQDANPYVIAWLGSIFLLSILYALWVFLADGARKMQEFGSLVSAGRSRKPMSRARIKLGAALWPVFVVVWTYLAAAMDALVPR